MGGAVRIMSANLWTGAARPQALAELLDDLRVDVLCAQEITLEQAAAVARVLPHGDLDTVGPGGRRPEGLALALRHPGRVRHLPLPHRGGRIASLEPSRWPGLRAPLEIANVHIAAPHMGPAALLRRRKQLRRLEQYLIEEQQQAHAEGRRPQPLAEPRPLELIAGGEPEAADLPEAALALAAVAPAPASDPDAPPLRGRARVLVGDFNATPLWPVYRRVALHMTDAAIDVAQRRGRPLERTWGPWHGSPRLLRIDHGFVRAAEVEDFQVVSVPGSDHSGIVLDVAPS